MNDADQEIIDKVEGKTQLSSVDAAALFLSEGRTTDPELATHIASGGDGFDIDALQRAHLRRAMGFDFKVKLRGRKVFVSSKEGPEVRTHAKVLPGEVDDRGNIISDDLIARLVDACLRLKTKWDDANAKAATS